MTKPNRLGTALTAASIVALAAGCAGPGNLGARSASIFGGKVDDSNIGLATRAQVALAGNEIDKAISLAERAVDNSPRDAGFRALLGNSYLAAGRFTSAEAAFRDSLSLLGAQPQVVLKLALVQIAQGKTAEAREILAFGQSILDPADVGLALALAGDAATAITVLEPAARTVGADSRIRQNLALAYALAGDWQQARVVASQDVPADQLEARIQQWMVLAKPARASDQVASIIGIQPAAADPGQPTRLALNQTDDSRQAAVEPMTAPVAANAELSATTTVDLPPVELARVEPAAVPIEMVTPSPEPAKVKYAAASEDVARPAISPAVARVHDPVPVRRANLPKVRSGNSKAVVQLGAYSSRDRVSGAWAKVAAKHQSLKSFTPVTARYAGAKGTVYRLSVQGFASDRDAISLCSSLKRAGANCFVRTVSGDAPVRFASR
jgi:D-alanyl-D-alanine carboxypeptidase